MDELGVLRGCPERQMADLGRQKQDVIGLTCPDQRALKVAESAMGRDPHKSLLTIYQYVKVRLSNQIE
jgi:hypothetical protein